MTAPNGNDKPAENKPAPAAAADAPKQDEGLEKKIAEQAKKDIEAHRSGEARARGANEEFGGEGFSYGKKPESK